MLTENQINLLKKLKKLKVFSVMNDDIDFNDFEAIYYAILHEVDLYEENEDCNMLTLCTYKSAKAWLNNSKKYI